MRESARPACRDSRWRRGWRRIRAKPRWPSSWAQAEAFLAENPEDVRGWEVLAPVYLQMGRGGDAVVAFRNAMRLDGETAMRQTGLGEALVATAGRHGDVRGPAGL